MCAERLSVASPYMSVSRPVGVRPQSVFWLLEGRGRLGGGGRRDGESCLDFDMCV